MLILYFYMQNQIKMRSFMSENTKNIEIDKLIVNIFKRQLHL